MKKTLTLAAIAAAALAGSSAMAFDSVYNPGDIILGFKTTTGTGATTNILVNLGAATQFRDAGGDILNIGNVGSLLSSTYGAGWADATGLNIGIIGANNSNPINNSGSVAPGEDPNSTVYLSARRNTIGTAGSASSTRPGNTIPLDGSVQPLAASFSQFAVTFNAAAVDGVLSQSSATTNGWSQFVTGGAQNDFSTFNIERAFTAGSFGTLGAAGSIENALDLYRLPEFAPPGEDGRGQYVGTFTINSLGQIDFIAVPEPATAGVFGLTALLGLAFRRNRKVTA